MSADECNKSIDNFERTEIFLVDTWKNAFEFTCKKFISAIKFSLFKLNYKEIYKKCPDKLKGIHELLCSQLTKEITEDLDEMYKEHSIEFLLNSLDAILKKYKNSSPEVSWRPSGNPQEDLRDHIYPVKLKYKEQLQLLLQNMSANNEVQINALAIKHAEILQLKETIDDMHEELSNVYIELEKADRALKNTVHSKRAKAETTDFI